MSFFDEQRPYGLAPMEGVSDLPLRLWLQLLAGPAFMGTPFLRVTESSHKSLPLGFAPEIDCLQKAVPYKLIPQIMASRAEDFARVGEKVLKHAPFVDLNCGCPSPKTFRHGAGSSLLAEIDTLHKFLQSVTRELGPSKVSVKMRLGIHSELEFHPLIDCLREHALHHVTVHGRTKVQKYAGRANWSLIHQAGSDLPMPLMGSGDIRTEADLQKRLATSVKSVIIGRGALSFPWILSCLEFKTRHRHGLSLTGPTLVHILGSFSILNHAFIHDPDGLIALAKEGVFADSFYLDSHQWQDFYQLVSGRFLDSSCSPFDLDLGLKNLGRLKLIWFYLRESLPSKFATREILRSKSHGAFLEQINLLALDGQIPCSPRDYQPSPERSPVMS